ncbi:16S rRNA (cytidine(1402)-2'-O)-methyltransferase [Alphaproteobacteria bacterium]|nr:16S rRNA (cytidine(1402)-2'-O)-methyltransferase [Alphaproteobacteria bacterium]
MYKKITSKTVSKKIKFAQGLYIVSTPIGNRYDITIRAIMVLQASDTLICEDTRVTKKLFKLLNLDIKEKKWMSYNDHSPETKKNIILEELKLSKIVSLVSDAGTPLISDPGYKLINYVINAGYKIYSLPGACSAISSLVISGLKTDKFSFLGFLPKNKNNYIKLIKEFSILKSTLILYEKANRIDFLLNVLNDNFTSFKLVIVRELTKLYEDVIHISKNNINNFLEPKLNLKGEITVLLEIHSNIDRIYTDYELFKELKKLKPSQVSAMLAKSSIEDRSTIYKRCVKLLNKNE